MARVCTDRDTVSMRDRVASETESERERERDDQLLRLVKRPHTHAPSPQSAWFVSPGAGLSKLLHS